jgi:hypothetical protein
VKATSGQSLASSAIRCVDRGQEVSHFRGRD